MDDHRGGTQLRVIPMPTYEDVAAAAAWLCAAFGFRERERFGDPDDLRRRPTLAGQSLRGGRHPDRGRRRGRPLRPRPGQGGRPPQCAGGRPAWPALPRRGHGGPPLDVPPARLTPGATAARYGGGSSGHRDASNQRRHHAALPGNQVTGHRRICGWSCTAVQIHAPVLAVWFIRRCQAPAERAIPDLMISSGVIRHQRPPRTGSLDDPAPHARISIQEHAYLCIIYVWRYKDYSACEVA